MKELYLEQRLEQLKAIENAYRLTNQLRHACSKIGVPGGFSEPAIHNYQGQVTIWLWSWPLEASCGWVSELEELLLATAVVKVDGGSHTVDYRFLQETPFYFRVVCSPSNCKWKGDPGKLEYKESTERPDCG